MVELDLTEDQARLMWCQGIRARELGKKGIRKENIALLAESWAWFDQILNTITMSVSAGITLGPNGLPVIPGTDPPQEIDGSETNKP